MSMFQTPPTMKSLPSRGLNTSTSLWMQQKTVRDSQLWNNESLDLWIVQNKLYDLKQFSNSHPGGSAWIKLTKGQDITEHFVVHHLRQQKAREVLKKYYVKDCQKQVTRFTFSQQGLYRTVKHKMLKKYSIQQIQNPKTSEKHAFILFSLFLIFLTVSAMLSSYIATAFCSFLLIGIFGVGHNFVHKDHPLQYLLLLCGFTKKQWQIMHCISHHEYPITQLDYEAAAFEPLVYYLRTSPENDKLIKIYIQIVYFMIQPLNMALNVVILPIIKFVKPDLWYGFPMLIMLYFYAFNGNVWLSFKMYLFLYGIFGVMFGRASFCRHRLQELWTEGSQKIEDYGEHTVASTNDTDIQLVGFWSYFLAAGLNIHTPHHFFPTIDHSMLKHIRQIIEQTCKQMNIRYHQTTRLKCFDSLSKGLQKRLSYKQQ